jgi:hypothetical protein
MKGTVEDWATESLLAGNTAGNGLLSTLSAGGDATHSKASVGTVLTGMGHRLFSGVRASLP